MVLERIVDIRTAVTRPWWMFVVGAVVSLISLVFSVVVFPQSIGLFTVFMITFAMTPFMVNLLTYEEAVEETNKDLEQMNLFQRHSAILKVYSAFFGGMILSMSLVFLFLPETTVQKLFETQITEIKLIRGNIVFLDKFQTILVNNLGVLFLSFIFSFLLGSGAIFILAWNASILATAIGLGAKTIGGVSGFPLAMIGFFPHGSLELLAYFIGGIAGGIISATIMRRHSKRFLFIMKDSFGLMIISVILLVIAGTIEAFQIAI